MVYWEPGCSTCSGLQLTSHSLHTILTQRRTSPTVFKLCMANKKGGKQNRNLRFNFLDFWRTFAKPWGYFYKTFCLQAFCTSVVPGFHTEFFVWWGNFHSVKLVLTTPTCIQTTPNVTCTALWPSVFLALGHTQKACCVCFALHYRQGTQLSTVNFDQVLDIYKQPSYRIGL